MFYSQARARRPWDHLDQSVAGRVVSCAYHDVIEDCPAVDYDDACSRCGAQRADEVSLTLPDGEYGFCSPACFVAFTRERWMLGGTS